MENTPQSSSLLDSNETKEFLDGVNATQKKLGHNKLQLQIDELQSEITRLKKIDVEKEMKLTLFKKNISTLQTQSQERLDEISRLKNMLENNPQMLELGGLRKEIEELTVKNNKLEIDIAEKDRLYNIQLCKNKELETITEKEQTQQNVTNEELNTLKEHMDKITKENNELQAEIDRLKSQVDLKSNISDNIMSELQELKDELAKIKSENKMLEDELKLNEQNSSNLCIQLQEVEEQLHVQLEQQKSKSTVRNTSSNNSILGRHRGLGIKQSKKR